MRKGHTLSERSESKGFAPILTILLIVVVVIGGYLVYSGKINLPQKQVACTMEAKICPDGTGVGRSGPNCEFASCPQVSDETSNWRIYTNTKYNYSINYPQNLLVEENRDIEYSFMTGKKAKANVITRSRDDFLTNPQASSEWFRLEIIVEDNDEKLTPNELVNSYLKGLEPDNSPYKSTEAVTKKINDSLKPYKNEKIEGVHALFGFEYDYDVIVQTKGNKIYTFIYTGDNGGKVNEEVEKLITQILSTFKFL